MRAVAHSPEFAAKVGIPVSVGKDFHAADKARAKAHGGQYNLPKRKKPMKGT